MRTIYAIVMAACWAFLAHEFHWSMLSLVAAIVLTLTASWYLSRVIEDDRRS